MVKLQGRLPTGKGDKKPGEKVASKSRKITKQTLFGRKAVGTAISKRPSVKGGPKTKPKTGGPEYIKAKLKGKK